MIDIIYDEESGKLNTFDTQGPKAQNLMSVQLGELEYAKDFGIDLRYFLQENIAFQNDSFQSYLVETLANRGINIADITPVIHTLFAEYKFTLAPEEISTSLLAR